MAGPGEERKSTHWEAYIQHHTQVNTARIISWKYIRIHMRAGSCLRVAAMATGMDKKDKHLKKANGK